MPEYAIAHDHVRAALSVDELGDALDRLAHGLVVAIQCTNPSMVCESSAPRPT